MTGGWLEIVSLPSALDFDGFSQCNRSNLRQFLKILDLEYGGGSWSNFATR